MVIERKAVFLVFGENDSIIKQSITVNIVQGIICIETLDSRHLVTNDEL